MAIQFQMFILCVSLITALAASLPRAETVPCLESRGTSATAASSPTPAASAASTTANSYHFNLEAVHGKTAQENGIGEVSYLQLGAKKEKTDSLTKLKVAYYPIRFDWGESSFVKPNSLTTPGRIEHVGVKPNNDNLELRFITWTGNGNTNARYVEPVLVAGSTPIPSDFTAFAHFYFERNAVLNITTTGVRDNSDPEKWYYCRGSKAEDDNLVFSLGGDMPPRGKCEPAILKGAGFVRGDGAALEK